ncbi:MAG TPA: hypothetical protein PLO56_09645 [Rhodothermales bacterium]|nr:hypothetical protein [Rhodothermales bacterium]
MKRLIMLLLGFAGCTSARLSQEPVLTTQHIGGTARFQAVSVVDEQVVWASGTDGQYAKTTNGGLTWQNGQVKNAETLQFRDIHAVNAQIAYLMSAGEGAQSRIYKTTDGGKNWILQFMNPDEEGFYDAIAFWDENRGVAFSDNIKGVFPIIRTEDGGKKWVRVPAADIPPALKGEGGFAASGTCLIVGENGRAWIGTGASSQKARVLRSLDYGKTWEVADTPIVADSGTSGINALLFVNARKGYAFGGDFQKESPPENRVATTDDGGKTWRLLPNPALKGSIFGAAQLPKSETFVIVGPKGAQFSNNAGLQWQDLSREDFWSVGCGPKSCWMVGPERRIVRIGWSPTAAPGRNK